MWPYITVLVVDGWMEREGERESYYTTAAYLSTNQSNMGTEPTEESSPITWIELLRGSLRLPFVLNQVIV